MSPDVHAALAHVTAKPSPALALLRTLRREGLRLTARYERPQDKHDNGWRYTMGGKTKLVDELGFYRIEWTTHKDMIKMHLRTEWGRHTHEGLPYCTGPLDPTTGESQGCGAVGDTIEALCQARGEPIDITDPDLRRCITCHPEIEEKAYE